MLVDPSNCAVARIFRPGEFGDYFSPNIYDEVIAAEVETAQEYLAKLQADRHPGPGGQHRGARGHGG